MADTKKFLWLDVDGQLHEQTAAETISVANAVESGHAVNKGQLDSAVGSLTDLVNAEAARATQAEAALGDSLSTETANRVAADAALSASLTSETNARTAADTALGGRIDAEEAARIAADTAEAAARAAADTALRTDLDAEIARATAAESAEATARTNADAALQAAIDALSSSSNTALTAAIASLTADLEAEEAARIAADAALQSELNAEEARAAAAEAAEQAARIAADNALQSDIDAEEARAIAAEGVLTADLAAEVARAEAAELALSNDIDAEQSRAQAAEGTLTTNLAAEIARAEAAEAALEADLDAEIARATAAESANLQEAKDYADARVQGLSWKASVDYAFPRDAAGLSLPADAESMITDVGMSAGDRVLLYSADQSAHADNGIYVVAGNAFVRAADMAAGKDAAGATVYVERASSAGAAPGTSFVCANAGTAIVGTDALEFVIFSRAENLQFSSGTQKNGTTVSLKIEADRPVYVNGSNELSFRADESDFDVTQGGLKLAGALVGGTFVSADGKHTHTAVAINIASAQTTGCGVKSDGTAATYDSSYFRGVVDAADGEGNARVVTSGKCAVASGALSSFVADEIVYLGSAAGVFSKYADIPSGKWAVPVGFCIDGSNMTVHRMPAAMKA